MTAGRRGGHTSGEVADGICAIIIVAYVSLQFVCVVLIMQQHDVLVPAGDESVSPSITARDVKGVDLAHDVSFCSRFRNFAVFFAISSFAMLRTGTICTWNSIILC